MPLGYSMLRIPWAVLRRLSAIGHVYADGNADDPYDWAAAAVVLAMLVDAELDRLRAEGRVSAAMEAWLVQNETPS